MSSSPRDLCAPSLARGGPRRWVLKMLAGGAVGLGLLTRGTRMATAGDGDRFEQCLRACRSSCGEHHHCPSPEHCAASCSNAEW